MCVLAGLRFVRECIRGLKCRSVEAVHSPAHHACKPQGSALLSREREKHQPLTTALSSPSQIADTHVLPSFHFLFTLILFVIPFTSSFTALFLSVSHTPILFLSQADSCSSVLLSNCFLLQLLFLPCFFLAFLTLFGFYSSNCVKRKLQLYIMFFIEGGFVMCRLPM